MLIFDNYLPCKIVSGCKDLLLKIWYSPVYPERPQNLLKFIIKRKIKKFNRKINTEY